MLPFSTRLMSARPASPHSVLATRPTAAFAIGLVLVSILMLYLPGLSGPWVFDDYNNIVENAPAEHSIVEVARTAFSNTSGIAGRSVSAFSFALNHLYGDGTPASFKLTNTLLHLASILAAFLLTYVVSRQLNPLNSRSAALLLALAASTIWALHPLHVSTVLYVVQRMTVLATLFSFLAILAWIFARGAKRHTTMAMAFGSSGLFVTLATLSKESGVLAIAYIALFEILNPKGLARNAKSQAVFFAAALGCVFLALTVLVVSMPESIMGGYVLRDFNWVERLLTQPVVATEYLKQIVLADVESMRFYYDNWPTTRTFGVQTLIGILILSVLFLSAIVVRRIEPVASFGIGVFFASHILESTVIPLEHAFEHRNYIGSFGLLLAACATLLTIGRRYRRVVPMIALMLAFLPVSLGLKTASRVNEWSDSLVLHSEAFRRAPDSIRAASDQIQQKFWIEGDEAGALAVANQSLNRGPDDLYRRLQLSIYESLAGSRNRLVDEELLETASTAPIRRELLSLVFYITKLVSNGHSGMPNTADMTKLLSAINDNPNKRITRSERANLLMDHSDLLIRRDHRAEALERILEASALMPGNPDVLIRVAKRQAAVGNFDEALLALKQARVTAEWWMPDLLRELDVVRTRIQEANQRLSTASHPG